jgi:hypothetical protein
MGLFSKKKPRTFDPSMIASSPYARSITPTVAPTIAPQSVSDRFVPDELGYGKGTTDDIAKLRMLKGERVRLAEKLDAIVYQMELLMHKTSGDDYVKQCLQYFYNERNDLDEDNMAGGLTLRADEANWDATLKNVEQHLGITIQVGGAKKKKTIKKKSTATAKKPKAKAKPATKKSKAKTSTTPKKKTAKK